MTQPHDHVECARAWMALSAAHALVAERLSQALTRACDLSINDFEVLLRLDRVPPDGLRLNELRETVRLSQPALSRMMTRLEAKDLLARQGDPADGRGVLVSITSAGREAVRKAAPVHAQALRECLLDRLSPAENAQLTQILGKVSG
jgi:DNA-binding MarR family transcriptional regulator